MITSYLPNTTEAPSNISAFSNPIKAILQNLKINEKVFIPYGKKTVRGWQKGYEVEILDTHIPYQESTVAKLFKDHQQTYIAYQRPSSKKIVTIEVITKNDAIKYMKIILFPNKKSALRRLNSIEFTWTEIYDMFNETEMNRVPNEAKTILKELIDINTWLPTKVGVIDTNTKTAISDTLLSQ
jgi:hypothetical protein